MFIGSRNGFRQVALASTTEVEYHLEFAADASIIPRREFAIRQQEVIEVRRMLTGLVKHIRQSDRTIRRIVLI